MATAVYDWERREWVRLPNEAALRAVRAATVAHTAILTPAQALAQNAAAVDPSGFANVLNAALQISDWLCVGVIMFAGGSWMFGDRTRAMQHLVGGGVGYLIIRKARLIQEFLKTL